MASGSKRINTGEGGGSLAFPKSKHDDLYLQKRRKKKRTENLEIAFSRIELVEDDVVLDGDARSGRREVGVVGGNDAESLAFRLPRERRDRVW